MAGLSIADTALVRVNVEALRVAACLYGWNGKTMHTREVRCWITRMAGFQPQQHQP
jgi:hypothetical protein